MTDERYIGGVHGKTVPQHMGVGAAYPFLVRAISQFRCRKSRARRSPSHVARALFLVFALATSALAETARFPFAFQSGLNEREDPGALPAGWAAVGSYNFDYGRDGSAQKRTGYALDEHIASGDTVINGLFMLRNARSYFPRSWGLAVAGSKWQKRHPTTGTYTALTAPSLLKIPSDGTLRAVDFDGELVGGGDASAVWHFDGTNLNRLLFSVPWDSAAGTADTTSGGSLTASTEYSYYWTYGTRLGNESYAAGPIIDTTSATAKTITLSDLPRYPDAFTGATDTAQITKRFIYRTSADASGYLTAIPVADTTFADDGSLALDEGVNFPAQRQPMMRGAHLGMYRDQLWTTGPGVLGETGFVLNENLPATNNTASAGWEILPYNPGMKLREIFKTSVAIGWEGWQERTNATIAPTTNGTYQITSANAGFVKNGVVPGDYGVAYAPSISGASIDSTFAIVLAVISDSVLIIDRDIARTYATTGGAYVSFGKNIFRIDDEFIGMGDFDESYFNYTHRLVVGQNDDIQARGLFGSTVATHTAGTPIYRIDPRIPVADQSAESYGSYDATKVLFRSETLNAIRQQTQSPTYLPEEPTGLFRGNGFLGVVSRSNVMQVRDASSEDETIASVSPMIEGVGSLAPGVVVPHSGGAFVLDERGVYHVGQDGATYLSGALGDSIRGRTSAGYYAKAAGAYHDGRLYVSVPRAASWACDTWVGDLTRQTPDGGPPWTRYVGPNPRCYATFEDANDETQLFYGAGDTANVYRFDETLKTDAGADITAEVYTPRFAIPGEVPVWTELHLTMANSDSVAVYAEFRSRAGTYRSILQRSFDPDVATDVTAEREPRDFVIPLRPSTSAGSGGIEAEAMQIRIKAMGDGFCTIHRGELVATRKAR